ncbi:beta-galactosidase [Arthrobacter glacialis]|uniref:Beta-galactosidase n=1 Tax=Arthrobacter glacialis TaxID=1664 RepID=A0A2S3ZS96_ARTGL|nr:beta-galactosidase [Arthrobacter glacialis]POH72105.1 beta-galactosidase [Arthrobacter glacialis]
MHSSHEGPPRPIIDLDSGLAFGCDYNPEQWDPDVWVDDVAAMKQAGVNFVAINIFGWSHLEPRQGEYDFTNLDAIIDLLHANGISINLGTATASPPPWLTTTFPEVLPKVEDGTRRYPGGRQAFCPSSPIYRHHAALLVEQVAQRYGSHPAVALWHVSNEIGCHNAHCYCETSSDAFRDWLMKRYENLDALNTAWGTDFWSQRVSDWNEIWTPRLTLSSRNPGQSMDFRRFSSDELRSNYLLEADIIRRHSDIPVTTNFMVTAHIRNMDYFTWTADMDIIANDHYLDHRLGEPTTELSFSADLTRGLAKNAPWILMEHSTGGVNWQPHNVAKAPGEMLRNSLAHVARGADGVCFFQWRASLQGSEKFHSALMPHAGKDSQLWRDVVELGETVAGLAEVVGSRVESNVAFVFSWESWWAVDAETRPSAAISYLEQAHAIYAAFHAQGITVTMVAPGSDLSGFSLVVVPTLYMISDAHAAQINDYVQNGGHAVVTFYSGIVDDEDRVRTGGYPGGFRDMLGIRTEEFAPLLPEQVVELSDGRTSSLWAEKTTLHGATAVASYVDGPTPGGAAVTVNDFGQGRAWYLGTVLDPAGLTSVVRNALDGAGVAPVAPEADANLEMVRRTGADNSYLFIINHSQQERRVSITGHEILTKTDISQTLTVPAGAVRVIREVVLP